MKTLYVQGEGLLTERGDFYPEANVRAAVQALNRLCQFIADLPPEVRAELDRIAKRPDEQTEAAS